MTTPGQEMSMTAAATEIALQVLGRDASPSDVEALQKSIVLNLCRKPFTASSKFDKRALLTEMQERSMVALMISFEDMNWPLMPLEGVEIVAKMIGKPPNWDGFSWWRSFSVRRDAVINYKVLETITPQRVSTQRVAMIESFCRECLQKTKGNGDVKPHTICNLDETGFYSQSRQVFRSGICRATSGRSRHIATIPQSGGSLVCIISQDGTLFMAIFMRLRPFLTNRKELPLTPALAQRIRVTYGLPALCTMCSIRQEP